MDKEKMIEYIEKMLHDADPETIEFIYYFLLHR